LPISPLLHAHAGFVERGVKPALETNHAGHTGGLYSSTAGLGTGHRQVNRLLAKNMFARLGGTGDEVAVRVGGRRDGHHVYAGVGKHRVDSGDLRAVLLSQL
jgi:hypothetical protein